MCVQFVCVYILMSVCVERVVSAQKGPKDPVNLPGTQQRGRSRLAGSCPCPCIPGERGIECAHTHAHTLRLWKHQTAKQKSRKQPLPWPLLEGNVPVLACLLASPLLPGAGGSWSPGDTHGRCWQAPPQALVTTAPCLLAHLAEGQGWALVPSQSPFSSPRGGW